MELRLRLERFPPLAELETGSLIQHVSFNRLATGAHVYQWDFQNPYHKSHAFLILKLLANNLYLIPTASTAGLSSIYPNQYAALELKVTQHHCPTRPPSYI